MKNEPLQFEYYVSEYGGRRTLTQFKYWPLFGALQIRQQYTKWTNAFNTVKQWGKWKWIEHTCDRAEYMNDHQFQEAVKTVLDNNRKL